MRDLYLCVALVVVGREQCGIEDVEGKRWEPLIKLSSLCE
jgi:hypothetical protein